HPALAASWRRTGAGLAVALVGTAALEARMGGGGVDATDSHAPTQRTLPLAAFWLAMAHADAYVHLGLNNRTRGAPLFASIGAPTTLTLARRGIAGLLWGHLLARRPASRGYLALALAAALATDIADGAVARAQARTTWLGGYLDGLADFEFWTALALTFGARRLLPRWLLLLLLARWLGPLAVAYAAYFGKVSRVPLNSTALGKISGGAQAATLAVALLPDATQKRIAPLRGPLHAATALLLVAAPLAHLWKLRDGTHTIQSRR
ncbi:MAG: CDP-alcohol phosphatidyltransferase family protein, partial [Ktedonobacterales bacterium]